ncbi:MAG TPA: hypothetical protein VHE79_05655, partial [Spirochaetia bacterium]
MKNIKIGVKLVTFGALLLIVPLAIVAYLAVTRASAALTEMENTLLVDRAKDLAQIVDNVYAGEQKVVLGIASDPDVV